MTEPAPTKTWTVILHRIITPSVEDLREHLLEHLHANGHTDIRTTTLESWLYDQTTHADGTRPPSSSLHGTLNP